MKSLDHHGGDGLHQSQPARAVWIEIQTSAQEGPAPPRHSLRGLCGLKSRWGWRAQTLHMSQPARAVWIEIPNVKLLHQRRYRHSLRGLCGLKFCGLQPFQTGEGHSLRGLCGLKYPDGGWLGKPGTSQPARAVWIEIARR